MEDTEPADNFSITNAFLSSLCKVVQENPNSLPACAYIDWLKSCSEGASKWQQLLLKLSEHARVDSILQDPPHPARDRTILDTRAALRLERDLMRNGRLVCAAASFFSVCVKLDQAATSFNPRAGVTLPFKQTFGDDSALAVVLRLPQPWTDEDHDCCVEICQTNAKHKTGHNVAPATRSERLSCRPRIDTTALDGCADAHSLLPLHASHWKRSSSSLRHAGPVCEGICLARIRNVVEGNRHDGQYPAEPIAEPILLTNAAQAVVRAAGLASEVAIAAKVRVAEAPVPAACHGRWFRWYGQDVPRRNNRGIAEPIIIDMLQLEEQAMTVTRQVPLLRRDLQALEDARQVATEARDLGANLVRKLSENIGAEAAAGVPADWERAVLAADNAAMLLATAAASVAGLIAAENLSLNEVPMHVLPAAMLYSKCFLWHLRRDSLQQDLRTLHWVLRVRDFVEHRDDRLAQWKDDDRPFRLTLTSDAEELDIGDEELRCQWTNVLDNLAQRNLRELRLHMPHLTVLPTTLTCLRALTKLSLETPKLNVVPYLTFENEMNGMISLSWLREWVEIPCSIAQRFFSWKLRLLALKMPKLERLPWAFDILYNVEQLYLDVPEMTTLQWGSSLRDCVLRGVTKLYLSSARLILKSGPQCTVLRASILSTPLVSYCELQGLWPGFALPSQRLSLLTSIARCQMSLCNLQNATVLTRRFPVWYMFPKLKELELNMISLKALPPSLADLTDLTWLALHSPSMDPPYNVLALIPLKMVGLRTLSTDFAVEASSPDKDLKLLFERFQQLKDIRGLDMVALSAVGVFFGVFAFDGLNRVPQTNESHRFLAFFFHAGTFVAALGIVVLVAVVRLFQQKIENMLAKPQKRGEQDGARYCDESTDNRLLSFRFFDKTSLSWLRQMHRILRCLAVLVVMLIVFGFSGYLMRAWMTYIGDRKLKVKVDEYKYALTVASLSLFGFLYCLMLVWFASSMVRP